MAPIKWDAYRTFNIASRDSDGMTCVGNTIYKKRCRREISDKSFSRICSILDELEIKAPANARSSLERLAQLSLCEENHQRQASNKIEEWEVAIQEATQFYEIQKGLKERNRELKEKLKEERSRREKLERSFKAETSRTIEELESVGSMGMEVIARENKENAEKISESLNKGIAEMEECISTLRAGWDEERQNLTTTLQNKAQTILSMSSELEELKASESIAVQKASKLSLQLESELLANSKMQSELIEIKSERDLALLQKDESKSQLDIAADRIDRIGIRLQEAEAARDVLLEQEVKYTGLVQEVGTLNTQLSSERRNAAEVRQYLQTATDNLSRTNTELKAVNAELFSHKEKLEKLQVEFAKARDNFEEERRELSVHQGASLARIDELMQEMAYARTHPFKTFFVNLSQVTIRWVKSVVAYVSRLRPRKAIMQENMSSP
jgi:ABC-type transporter Mla subunit MlaD